VSATSVSSLPVSLSKSFKWFNIPVKPFGDTSLELKIFWLQYQL